MTNGKLRIAAIASVLVLAACTNPTTGDNDDGGGDVDSDPYGSEVPLQAKNLAESVNEHRTNQGLSALTWSSAVFDVAQAHSNDMAEHDFFDHEGSDGSTLADRLDAAGVSYGAAGENIARGYTSADDALQAWLGSSQHKDNIENSNFTHHGIGYDPDGHYWTHVFIGK
jgi:uncharacterized protein YkwD